VGSVQQTLDNQGEYVLLGRVPLTRGPHRLKIDFHSSSLRPGSGGAPAAIGPLVLSSDDPADARVATFPTARASSLCGRRWDWVEALPQGMSAP
jgi:hypothetical protein